MDKASQYPILLNYLRVVRRQVKVLLWMMISAALIVGALTFFGERTYTARATFLTSATGTPFNVALLRVATRGGDSGSEVSPAVIFHLIQSNRMAEGVVQHFRDDPRFEIAKGLTLKRARRIIDTFEVTEGSLMGIDATSTDPVFSKEVANFCVDYLNAINEQMMLTTDKPMVKVLDPAQLPIAPTQRYTIQKSLAAAFVVGLLGCLYFVLLDYFRGIKKYGSLASMTEVPNEEAFESEEKTSWLGTKK